MAQEVWNDNQNYVYHRTETTKITYNQTKRSSKIMVFGVYGDKAMENIIGSPKKGLKKWFSNQTKSVITLTFF